MTDESPGVTTPPLFAQSETTLQLLFDHDRNAKLLSEWLAESYTVDTPGDPALDETVDICLVDDGAFAEHQPALQAWKQRSAPVFAPVLLVSEEPVSEEFEPEEWQTIDGLYIVDDVISMPIEKPVLHRRLSNLLERRTLSKTLDSKYRRSEERFSSLFTTLPDPAFVTDADGTLRFLNDTFSETCGIDRDQIIGNELSALDCLGVDAVEQIKHGIESALAADPVDDTEITFHRSDGEQRVAAFNVTATAIDGEQFVTIVLRDITERVAHEARLAESEQRFQQIAAHLNEVIWMIDSDRDLMYLSPGYERLTGYTTEPLRNGHFSEALEHVHPEDRARIADEFESLFADLDADEWDDEYHFEYRLVHKDGTVRWVQTDAYPLVTPDGEQLRVVGLIDDITDRKLRERELERQNERLDEFAGIISHDLRNPLQVVDARLGLLRNNRGDADEHLEAIERASDRMQRLIDDLLSLAREGETVSDVEAVELAAIAKLAWESVDAPTATLRIEGDTVIEADASRLRQLFENLFRNSVEHGSADSDENGPVIRVGTLGDGFYVADDGPGIPEEQRDRVFEQGYSTQDNGTGFGLNIVADIVAAHGWVISITAPDGGGTQFEIVGVETY